MGNFKDVAVIDVLVKPGDAIEVGGPLVTLETEKATMDVPSTVAGIVEQDRSPPRAAPCPRAMWWRRCESRTRRVRRLPQRAAAPAAPAAPQPPARHIAAAATGAPAPQAPAAAAATGGASSDRWPPVNESWVLHGPRQSLGATLRARTGRGPGAGERHGLQVADHRG